MKGGRRVSLERWDEISLAARVARTRAAEKRAALMLPAIDSVRATGVSTLRAIAASLNQKGITAPRGGTWSAVQIKRVLWAARWYQANQEHQQRLRQLRGLER
jgi:hypothetical protein